MAESGGGSTTAAGHAGRRMSAPDISSASLGHDRPPSSMHKYVSQNSIDSLTGTTSTGSSAIFTGSERFGSGGYSLPGSSFEMGEDQHSVNSNYELSNAIRSGQAVSGKAIATALSLNELSSIAENAAMHLSEFPRTISAPNLANAATFISGDSIPLTQVDRYRGRLVGRAPPPIDPQSSRSGISGSSAEWQRKRQQIRAKLTVIETTEDPGAVSSGSSPTERVRKPESPPTTKKSKAKKRKMKKKGRFTIIEIEPSSPERVAADSPASSVQTSNEEPAEIVESPSHWVSHKEQRLRTRITNVLRERLNNRDKDGQSRPMQTASSQLSLQTMASSSQFSCLSEDTSTLLDLGSMLEGSLSSLHDKITYMTRQQQQMKSTLEGLSSILNDRRYLKAAQAKMADNQDVNLSNYPPSGPQQKASVEKTLKLMDSLTKQLERLGQRKTMAQHQNEILSEVLAKERLMCEQLREQLVDYEMCLDMKEEELDDQLPATGSVESGEGGDNGENTVTAEDQSTRLLDDIQDYRQFDDQTIDEWLDGVDIDNFSLSSALTLARNQSLGLSPELSGVPTAIGSPPPIPGEAIGSPISSTSTGDLGPALGTSVASSLFQPLLPPPPAGPGPGNLSVVTRSQPQSPTGSFRSDSSQTTSTGTANLSSLGVTAGSAHSLPISPFQTKSKHLSNSPLSPIAIPAAYTTRLDLSSHLLPESAASNTGALLPSGPAISPVTSSSAPTSEVQAPPTPTTVWDTLQEGHPASQLPLLQANTIPFAAFTSPSSSFSQHQQHSGVGRSSSMTALPPHYPAGSAQAILTGPNGTLAGHVGPHRSASLGLLDDLAKGNLAELSSTHFVNHSTNPQQPQQHGQFVGNATPTSIGFSTSQLSLEDMRRLKLTAIPSSGSAPTGASQGGEREPFSTSQQSSGPSSSAYGVGGGGPFPNSGGPQNSTLVGSAMQMQQSTGTSAQPGRVGGMPLAQQIPSQATLGGNSGVSRRGSVPTFTVATAGLQDVSGLSGGQFPNSPSSIMQQQQQQQQGSMLNYSRQQNWSGSSMPPAQASSSYYMGNTGVPIVSAGGGGTVAATTSSSSQDFWRQSSMPPAPQQPQPLVSISTAPPLPLQPPPPPPTSSVSGRPQRPLSAGSTTSQRSSRSGIAGSSTYSALSLSSQSLIDTSAPLSSSSPAPTSTATQPSGQQQQSWGSNVLFPPPPPPPPGNSYGTPTRR